MHGRQSTWLIAMGLVLVACSGKDAQTPDPPLTLTKAPIQDGDLQSWSTGHTLPDPLRIVVTREGAPVPGVGILWQPDSAHGRMSPATSITDAQGVAISRWTLGTRTGEYHARAIVAEDPTLSVDFTATAYPNFPFSINLVAGDSQSAPVGASVPEPLVVRVGDEFDNDFPGAQIEWVVLSGDAAVDPALATTDPGGLAISQVTMGSTPGPVRVVARFPGAQTGPMVFFDLNAAP